MIYHCEINELNLASWYKKEQILWIDFLFETIPSFSFTSDEDRIRIQAERLLECQARFIPQFSYVNIVENVARAVKKNIEEKINPVEG